VDTHHVELRGFGWRHAGRRAWAVRGVDLTVTRGERVLLLGPSGAGKSTLLAALAGLLAEDSGDQEGVVTVDGVDARAAGEHVGIVFQDPQTQLVMSRIGDDVAFGLENRGVPSEQIWPAVDEALAAVGMQYPRDRSTSALSGGEQQRLALAGAIAGRPSLLLLDEPTANLDPDGAALVRTAVERVLADRRTTLVIVEHRVGDVLHLVDRVVVLEPGGGVVADGPPASVFAAHGAALAEEGVWVPGRPVLPRRSGAPAGEALLHARAVGYRHPGGTGPALDPTDCAVRRGRALAVLGPNGSGKTTLALLLGGLLRPTTGSVVAAPALVDGSLPPSPHQWRAAALTQRIGSVFQNPEHQFLTNRVDDELALGPRRLGRSATEVRSTVDDLLGRLRLDRLAAANPYTLSGGEQRRLSVATALATAPHVVILDEPTFGQDRRTWIELVDLLAKLRDDGRAVVTVTHDADFVDTLADSVLRLGAL
jgi:energy-coupling factor transport system ATP-binding protein